MRASKSVVLGAGEKTSFVPLRTITTEVAAGRFGNLPDGHLRGSGAANPQIGYGVCARELYRRRRQSCFAASGWYSADIAALPVTFDRRGSPCIPFREPGGFLRPGKRIGRLRGRPRTGRKAIVEVLPPAADRKE